MSRYGHQAKNCQGGVGDRLLSPTGRESRGRGLPLAFGAVRHMYPNPPKSPNLPNKITVLRPNKLDYSLLQPVDRDSMLHEVYKLLRTP
jgi:hypothetical protein